MGLISETGEFVTHTMQQTPAYQVLNTDLLGLMPKRARRVVEVGCMHGTLAEAYLAENPDTHYTGIDIDPSYAAVAAKTCARTVSGDIELLDQSDFNSLFPSDCWVFGDCLEHLRDPWRIVREVRTRIAPDGCLVACIPNAQHRSVQARLVSGLFRYENDGMLDRTHLRWFTRITIGELFEGAGWRIESGIAKYLAQQPPAGLLSAIGSVASAAGADRALAIDDAAAYPYMVKAVPA